MPLDTSMFEDTENQPDGLDTSMFEDTENQPDGLDTSMFESKTGELPVLQVSGDDPDSFLNRVGRSFNEFERSAAEGIGVFARLSDMPELEKWSEGYAKEQEEDIKTYGVPRRTSSFTSRMGDVSKSYEEEGIGAALDSGGLMLQDMLGDALGSLGPTLGAGLVAIPVAALSAPLGAATALILPFMVGGLAGTGQVKEEALKLGATPETADEYAAAGGAIVGMLDKIGASILLRNLVTQFGKKAVYEKLGEKVGEKVAKNAVEKGLAFSGQLAKGGLKGGVAELGTETAQEATQIAAAGLAADKTTVPYENAMYINRLVDAGALGFVGGKAMGISTTALGRVVQKQAANRALELDETLENLSRSVADGGVELGGSLAIEGTGLFGREKSSAPMTDRPIISGLIRSALSPLHGFARRGEGEARIVNLFANNAANISSAVGMDADNLRPVFQDLRRSFRIPILQKAIPDHISRRVFDAAMNRVATGDFRIDNAARAIREMMGEAQIDPETGRAKRTLKLDKKSVGKAVFGDKTYEGSSILGEDVSAAYDAGDIDTARVGALETEIQLLREEYKQRLETAPDEGKSIRKDMMDSAKFKELSTTTVFEPTHTGFYKRIIDAGIPMNFAEGYLPRVYKTGPFNRKKMIKVLKKRGKSEIQASAIVENIFDNEGVYDNTQTTTEINKPDSTKAVSSEKSFEQERRLSEEDVAALDKAGLLETDVEALMYKYILDANKRVIGKQMANEINEILPTLKGATQEEIKWISDLYDATQGKYKPLSNKKVQALQKWGLTGMYVLSLPLAGLTSLSEPLIVLSRLSPKYALFGTLDALYNATRAGTRKFFPKMPMRAKEKAFAGLLEGLDGSLSERFGDLANVTVARKVTNTFFKYTLLTTITQISRDIAFQATRRQMRDDLKTVAADNKKTNTYVKARRRLAEQGIANPDEESVQSWYALPDSKAKGVEESDPPIIRKALSRTVEEFIMAPNAVNRPLWMSDPHYASVAQLKGFAMVFGNTVGTRLWREVIVPLSRGRIPLTETVKYSVALVGIMAVALAVQSLKDNIRYGDNESPFDKLEGMDKIIEAILRTNILGGFALIYDALNASKYGTSFISAILGPLASTMEKGATSAYEWGGKGESRSLARFIADLVPVLRNIPQVRDIKAEVTDGIQDKLDDVRDAIVGD
jgi:hypothetical protein